VGLPDDSGSAAAVADGVNTIPLAAWLAPLSLLQLCVYPRDFGKFDGLGDVHFDHGEMRFRPAMANETADTQPPKTGLYLLSEALRAQRLIADVGPQAIPGSAATPTGSLGIWCLS
jgi:hypothetical protein